MESRVEHTDLGHARQHFLYGTNTLEVGKLEIEKEFEFDPQEPFEPMTARWTFRSSRPGMITETRTGTDLNP